MNSSTKQEAPSSARMRFVKNRYPDYYNYFSKVDDACLTREIEIILTYKNYRGITEPRLLRTRALIEGIHTLYPDTEPSIFLYAEDMLKESSDSLRAFKISNFEDVKIHKPSSIENDYSIIMDAIATAGRRSHRDNFCNLILGR